MKKWVMTAAAIALLAGCGGGDTDADADADAQPGSEASSEVPMSEAPTMSLHDACPVAEAALLELPEFTNQRADYDALVVAIDAIVEQSDTEVSNALAPLRAAAEGYLPDELGMFMDAERAFLDAIGTLRDRCTSVGSSAFQ